MFKLNYNPDVLDAIANLSNDEVFTPPKLVNEILDMLPQELFENKKTTFLDPVSKSGVFLREIANRLMKGLETQIPDKQERANHIFEKQIFGIAITELTSLLSRRSVYGTKSANNKYSFCETFENEQGNIIFDKIQHTWHPSTGSGGKCKYCGASQEVYDRSEDLETYAYQFIHTEKPKEIFNMKFDVIIGNPPYQLSDGSGGSSDAAMPIYNKFVEQAKKLNPKYLCMIIPSKWMVGGRGLNNFRNEMYLENRIKALFDFQNASECFPGIHLDGGACYFLWDRDYNGEIEYTFKSNDGYVSTSKRVLKNEYFQFVIRDNRVLRIVDKINSETKFSEIVSATKPFGIRKYLFNDPNRYPNANLSYKPFLDAVRIYGVKGLKGGAKRKIGYINRTCINKNINAIDKYKLFFTTSYSTNAIQPPKIIIGEPGDVCTETFLLIGPFNNEKQNMNCFSYMNTKFFKALLFFGKGTMQVTSSVFSLIPLVNFNEEWTDEKLYKKYDLSKEEIDFIESMIRPME